VGFFHKLILSEILGGRGIEAADNRFYFLLLHPSLCKLIFAAFPRVRAAFFVVLAALLEVL